MLHKQDLDSMTIVTFALPCGMWARRVHLVGEFNDWNETATPLQQTADGWKVILNLPRGKRFQYRYLLDGDTWLADADADCFVPNELDGCDSVVYT